MAYRFGHRLLAFVVETLGVFVDDDAQRHAIESRHDAAIELRRSPIDGDAVTLCGIANRFRSQAHEQLQELPFVVRRSANDEVPCCRPPRFFQPFEIRFEAAGRHHERFRAKLTGLTIKRGHAPIQTCRREDSDR